MTQHERHLNPLQACILAAAIGAPFWAVGLALLIGALR